jgi:TPR repeat protein
MSYSGYNQQSGYNAPQQHHYVPVEVGATFIPGGDDSYYLPEVIAPAPQRILNDIQGGNMQDGLANMEQQAHRVSQNSTPTPQPGNYHEPQAGERGRHGSYDYNGQPSQNGPSMQSYQQDSHRTRVSPAPAELPNFSPFPVLHNPPPNIPPTDDQKEASLEAAREAVLASNDPEVQLIWAQDALAYVDIAMANEQRVAATQPPRSQTPRIEHALREDAMKVVSFLADQEHPKAEFLRGMWLEFGKAKQRIDKKEAFLCYSRASEKGYARAFYRIGMQFESSNDALKAIKYYQRGVDAGDSASCYRLGMMTLLGQHGQVQDFERGLNLIYSSAMTADENAPQGAYVYGMLQARELAQVNIPERFLPLDIPGARVNIEKAAYLGFPKAQVKMGSAYELCELGCEFNPALSLHYNALAAQQGEADAEMAISKWFLCGHEGVFAKNEEMAFTYAQRAAVGGLATAQFAMGYFYEVGIYVPVNFKEAKEWYNRASANGNQDAGKRVDAISRSKTLSRKDHERVALAKIRQQYGSQGQVVPPVPAINMPDMSRLNLNSNGYPPANAPYPGPNRPGLSPSGGSNSTPPQRPGSAFGINPNLRPHSAATSSGPNSRGSSYQGGPPPQQRPYSNIDNNAQNYGRGSRLPPGPAQAPKGRGRGQPGPDSLPAMATPDEYRRNQARPDIGYAAPLDVAPPSQRQRMQRPNDPYSSKLQPPTPGNNGYPPRTGLRPNLPSQQASGPSNNSYYTGKPVANTPTAARPPVQPANIKPSKPNPSAPASNARPAKPNAVSANTTRPAGHGPKTFDQMGIPGTKSKSDCVSESVRILSNHADRCQVVM